MKGALLTPRERGAGGTLKRLCASLRVDTRGTEKHEYLALALAAVGGAPPG